jgi:GNAT superfamily N-acetyltransferase
MGDIASALASRYPTEFELGNDQKFSVRLMVPADVEAVLTFAKCLDLNDLLYLRVNITERSAVERWAHYIESGRTYTVLALDEERVVGEASLLHSTASWTRHIGEIRMQVIPQARRNGLARVLAQEIEWIAKQMSLTMLTARMTLEQEAAQRVFRQLGFQREAVLWDYVMTADGQTRNLLVATKRL